jgi:hypothetical protein
MHPGRVLLSTIVESLELDEEYVRRISKLLYAVNVRNVLALLVFAAIALDNFLHVRLNVQLQVTACQIWHLDWN